METGQSLNSVLLSGIKIRKYLSHAELVRPWTVGQALGSHFISASNCLILDTSFNSLRLSLFIWIRVRSFLRPFRAKIFWISYLPCHKRNRGRKQTKQNTHIENNLVLYKVQKHKIEVYQLKIWIPRLNNKFCEICFVKYILFLIIFIYLKEKITLFAWEEKMRMISIICGK